MITEQQPLSATELARASKLTGDVEHTLNEIFTREHVIDSRTEDQKYRTNSTNNAFLTMARHIVAVVPPSEAREEAIKKLREAHMYCDTSIHSAGKY